MSFTCLNCKRKVNLINVLGTAHRNHCPHCLWSKHVDLKNAGDRKSGCQAAMPPIGLTFKTEGFDKWGQSKQGELMLIHQCNNCKKITINRLAGDDSPNAILEIFEQSKNLGKQIGQKLDEGGIDLLEEADREEINTQLFGKY